MKNNDFELTNLPIEAQDETIDVNDFKLIDNSEMVHEQKFQTKPTTFFKDSLKRFSKNKSSVVAAGILGTLLILSFAVPVFDRNDIKEEHPEFRYLEPKLFNAGTGFWDGTRKLTKVAVDVGDHPDATTEDEKQKYWWPMPNDYKTNAVSEKVFTDVEYTSDRNEYAKGGYLQFGISASDNDDVKLIYNFENFKINEGDIYLKDLTAYDFDLLKAEEGDKAFFPNNYVQGKAAFFFNYFYDDEERSIKILDFDSKFEVTSLNITDIIKADEEVANNSITEFKDVSFSFVIENKDSGNNECVLIKNLEFETENAVKKSLLPANFTDANAFMLRTTKDSGYWSCTGIRKLHMAKVIYCDFTYDSYEAVFGTMEMDHEKLSKSVIDEYVNNGWCTFDISADLDENDKIVVDGWTFEILDEKCPIKEITNVVAVGNGQVTAYQITGIVEYYKYYGYDSMPRFIMGTDKKGQDMFKLVFDGLRISLLLGICTFAVCFVIGLIWGSISGYFGGWVDLIMERITDILHSLPWIVLMTLIILHLGQTFFVFGLSLCMTGWIGTAGVTRTQFYRFKGREYVLASRSLGASDARLIRKHILPNAMGTIITSSVLMIPSVIFSEATISYLGLGLKGMSSLGVILSENQTQLTIHPYLLVFPAVVIALLMISFNLFGNGLRDAVNPSLKGEEQ